MNEGTKRGVTRQRFFRLPKVPELWEAPELASLAALEVSLKLADISLWAAHPELCDLDGAYGDDDNPWPALCIAQMILSRSEQLRDVVAVYRKAVRSRWSPRPRVDKDDDIPF